METGFSWLHDRSEFSGFAIWTLGSVGSPHGHWVQWVRHMDTGFSGFAIIMDTGFSELHDRSGFSGFAIIMDTGFGVDTGDTVHWGS